MPEFALLNDQFQAGMQVDNRTNKKMDVSTAVFSKRISIRKPQEKRITLNPKEHQLVLFDFVARQSCDADISFIAVSVPDKIIEKDGLHKFLPVLPNQISQSDIEFDTGTSIHKTILPPANCFYPSLILKVSSSIVKPAGLIANKLVYYPYECMEQRTSKTIPFLILDDSFLNRSNISINKFLVNKSIGDYLKIIPEFMDKNGGMMYYRGSDHSSLYLTAYVLWTLRLAEEKGFAIDTKSVENIEKYLNNSTLDTSVGCFYQYILSMKKKADLKKLETFYTKRESMSPVGRIFLFRAIHNQGLEKEKLHTMRAEFDQELKVEQLYTYFEIKDTTYNQDIPFYSTRMITAMLLQAFLEVEGNHPQAARMLNCLLTKTSRWDWNTTQSNFWILYAMNQYTQEIEKPGEPCKVVLTLMGQPMEMILNDKSDTDNVWVIEKKIEDVKNGVDIMVQAPQTVYLTAETKYEVSVGAAPVSQGIKVARKVYSKTGEPALIFKKGEIYQVDILVDMDKNLLHYGVIDEPIPAGFEILRDDLETTRNLKLFSTENNKYFKDVWSRKEYSPDRFVCYSYSYSGKVRVTYFIKALYTGVFTWLPTQVQGMYNPEWMGRTEIRKITIE